MGVTVHGMTRSKELVETLHKSGASISYADTLLVYDHCALMDVKASAAWPPEIEDGKPAILILDNDDFKVDTVSGKATGAHWTNVMFVQPESYEKSLMLKLQRRISLPSWNEQVVTRHRSGNTDALLEVKVSHQLIPG